MQLGHTLGRPVDCQRTLWERTWMAWSLCLLPLWWHVRPGAHWLKPFAFFGGLLGPARSDDSYLLLGLVCLH